MGLSVAVASTIVLVGWIAFAGAVSTAILNNINDVIALTGSTSNDEIKAGVQLEINVTGLAPQEVNFSITNTGSKVIFLRNGTYAWNSVIIAYNNTNWQTYLIDSYTILAINISGTNISFDVSSHPSINPGEEASVQAFLPTGAPDIDESSIVAIVFASHYGVVALQEVSAGSRWNP
jgi:archaellum component FlaF (FlaF/FlaG flagellin family)